MQPGSVRSRGVDDRARRAARAPAARPHSPPRGVRRPRRAVPPATARRPSRAARLCITVTTAGLVLLGAALTPVGDRVAATGLDPVSRALATLAGADVPDLAQSRAEAAPPVRDGSVPLAVPREPVREPAPPSREGTGELAVVPGTDAPPGAGPVRRYLVEVEEGLGVAPAEFARTVHATLNDPRSWAADGALAFERVDASQADRVAFRVALTSADTTDRLCAPLQTNGQLSCHNGGRAVLNVVRWLDGVEGHPDLTVYRQYLVNHEVGHALGYGHVGCPGRGELAPVMQQQSKGVAPCLPNAWPHPEG